MKFLLCLLASNQLANPIVMTNQISNISTKENYKQILNDGETELWDRENIGGVNWNKTKAFVTNSWLGEELKITFKVEVQSFASWVNAYWSRAKGQLNVESILIR